MPPNREELAVFVGLDVGKARHHLVALDPATGQGTAIARTDLPTGPTALAFTADGRLIVAGRDRNLYELDPVTGASTLIGPTGVSYIGGMTLRVLP